MMLNPERPILRRAFLSGMVSSMAIASVAKAAQPAAPVDLPLDVLTTIWKRFQDPNGLPSQELQELLGALPTKTNLSPPKTIIEQRDIAAHSISFVPDYVVSLGKKLNANVSPEVYQHFKEFCEVVAAHLQDKNKNGAYLTPIEVADIANAAVFKKAGKTWESVDDPWNFAKELCRNFKSPNPAFDAASAMGLVQEAVAQRLDLHHASSIPQQRQIVAEILTNLPGHLRDKLNALSALGPQAEAMTHAINNPLQVDAFHEFCLLAAPLVSKTIEIGGKKHFTTPAEIAQIANSQLAGEFASNGIPKRSHVYPNAPAPYKPAAPYQPGARLQPT